MAVYLLHFDRPFSHAKHYVGYADDAKLEERIDQHRAASITDGQHHRLMVRIREAGIGFSVARVWWQADRIFERRLKQRGHTRRCPCCRPELASLRDTTVSEVNAGRTR